MEQLTLPLWLIAGTWLAGLGTVATVITSLYLAHRESKINLRVCVGERLIEDIGTKGFQQYCFIEITNEGLRAVTVKKIEWSVGFWQKRYFFQLSRAFKNGSSVLPIKLEDGQSATYMIPYYDSIRQYNWPYEFAKDLFHGRNPSWAAKTICLCVYTSVAPPVSAKIEKRLAQAFLESINANRPERQK